MSSLIKIWICIILTASLSSCHDEEVLEREYPRITTLDVTNITSDGAILQAAFKYRGDTEIIQYGFVWAENSIPVIQSGEKVIYEGNITDNQYTKELKSTLEANKLYNVRAFVQTNDIFVYGNQVSFTSLGSSTPDLTDFSPARSTLGDTIELYGQNFSYVENTVKFNDTNATVIINTDTLLKVIVPDQLQTAENYISVSTKNNSFTQYKKKFDILNPTIQGLSRTSGQTGDTVQIMADNIGHIKKHVKLYIKRISANGENNTYNRLDILQHDKKSISFIIPKLLDDKNKVKITVTDVEDSIGLDYLKPKMIMYAKDSAYWNDTLVFKVENFYTDVNRYTVRLNGLRISPILALDSLIHIKIPSNLNSINNSVRFNIAGLQFIHSFKLQKPVIREINRDSISFGDTVIIKGNNFHPSNNKIKLHDYFLLDPIHQSRTLIKFIVPKREDFRYGINNSEGLTISVAAQPNVVSNSVYLKFMKPKIESISSTNNNQEFVIRGYNFGKNPSVYLEGYLKFDSNIETSLNNNPHPFVNITEYSDNEIKFKLDPYNELDLNVWYSYFSFNYKFSILLSTNGYLSTFSNTYTIDVTKKYTLIDNQIFNLPSYFKRDRPQILFNEHYGFIIGGYSILPPRWPSGWPLADLHRFDPLTNTWTELDDWAKIGNESFVINVSFMKGDYIYIITETARLLKYDLNSNTWSKNPVLPDINNCQGYFALANKDFLIADYKVYELDIQNNEVQLVGNLPYSYGDYSAPFYQNNKLRIFLDNNEYELNESTFAWNLLSENNPLESQQVFNYNNNTYYLNQTGLYNRTTGETIETFPYPIGEIKLLFIFENKLVYRQDNSLNVTVDLNK